MVAGLLGLTGCAEHVMRLPTLDYPHDAHLEVRFDGEPMQLEVVQANDPKQAVVAQCSQRCSLTLPSGRYRLRAHGLAPTREHKVNLDGTTRVAVRPGSSVGRGLGIGFTAVGGVASLALPIGAIAPRCDRLDGHCGTDSLAIIGLAGLGLLTGGLILMGTSRTQLEVSTEEPPPPETAAFADGNGVGIRF